MPVTSGIDHHATGYSPTHAYGLVQAAALAYESETAVAEQAEQWGFEQVRHHRSRFTPPFPLLDTQAFTIASDRMIITAFRGTEPLQIRDWLSDVTTPPWPGPASTGYIHYGFGEALDSVYPAVRSTIEEFRTGRQTVWFTGHSLGGALAMLAGARLHLEQPKLTADGIYTFGQPRTCDRLLAAACNRGLAQRLHRFVNNNDVVPHLPPEPAYTHTAGMRYIDSRGAIHTSTSLLTGIADRARGLTADPLAPASDGVRDHAVFNYVTALKNNVG
ncbi:lipase family protein [Streptomyces sp. NPDC056500]|uniref:lipase family protein n=1 Tax=Streptomyces sp. NPDC056500 TaxID=3345840 RepID=UPI0036BB62FC